MKKSWWLLGWVVLLAGPGLAQAQHGGAGHGGAMAPAHFYGGSGGMHAPPPMHIAPPPPVHMPSPPPMHLPSMPTMHMPANPALHAAPHVPTTAAPHLPPTSLAHSPGSNSPGSMLPGSKSPDGSHMTPPSLSGGGPNAQWEAARLAALEARYLATPGLYGYPNYYGYYGFGVPYYNAASRLYDYGYGYGYGHGYGVYQRPYYYGYLSGVPYINYNNYSPIYYSRYYDLPNLTGAVTTQNALSTSPPRKSDESASQDPSSTDATVNDITVEQAREALAQAVLDLAAGRYQHAVQHAGKAALQLHEESQVHEVLWLALMGLADYRGAAIEAHAVDHFGVTPNWNDVAMKHDDPARFNAQMKKLETFVQRNKDSDFAAFLLGYNYLVLGHKDAARQWLETALKMDPQDVLCSKLVASLQTVTQAGTPEVGLLPNDAARTN